MGEMMTAKQAAQKWDITERRVVALCTAGRIPGAEKFGWSWSIPQEAEKPTDARRHDEYAEQMKLDIAPPIKIEREWAMPNSNTFDIKPIRELILSEMDDGLWIDPFANKNRLATITNDLNTKFDTDYHLDALEFLKMFENESVDGVLYDPPYSPRQVSECYQDVGYSVTWDTTKASFWGNHKREISRIVKPNGKVITFGWNSGGIGMKYGFDIVRILMVPHGGWHNDTICTVEEKTRPAEMHKSAAQRQNEIGADVEEKTAYQYTQEDQALISKLSDLSPDYWDFRDADTRELTHGIHNYPAVMVYPISRNLIRIVKEIRRVDCLFDPFSGSGTVLVEGMVAGIGQVYGNDLNPLAQLISKVKTSLVGSQELKTAYAAIVILNKKAEQIVGIENATLQLVFAFAAIAAFVGCGQGFHMEIAVGDYLPILWIGFVNTGLSCWLYFSSIGALPAQAVAICGCLETLSAVFLAGIFLRDALLPVQIFGAVLIVGGAVFGECAVQKRH